MNEYEVAEEQRVKQEMREQSKETGTCPAWKVFQLGANGTAMVSCGLFECHEMGGPEDETIMYHITSQRNDDGSVVTFKWPL